MATASFDITTPENDVCVLLHAGGGAGAFYGAGVNVPVTGATLVPVGISSAALAFTRARRFAGSCAIFCFSVLPIIITSFFRKTFQMGVESCICNPDHSFVKTVFTTAGFVSGHE